MIQVDKLQIGDYVYIFKKNRHHLIGFVKKILKSKIILKPYYDPQIIINKTDILKIEDAVDSNNTSEYFSSEYFNHILIKLHYKMMYELPICTGKIELDKLEISEAFIRITNNILNQYNFEIRKLTPKTK